MSEELENLWGDDEVPQPDMSEYWDQYPADFEAFCEGTSEVGRLKGYDDFMLIEELENRGYIVKKARKSKYDTCPACGGELSVDVEYMQENFGSDYDCVPKSEWSFYCSDEDACGEAGTFEELQQIAKWRKKHKDG